MVRRAVTSSRSTPRAQRTRRRVADLRPHPQQDVWFAPLPEKELRALAESIHTQGLQHPIHITPDNVILAGHQRVSAVTLLGWTSIDVILRHDLADDPTAAAMFALHDNVNRRQMGPLELAQAYQSLRQLEQQNNSSSQPGRAGADRMDLRDRLARHLGKSGRQLDRYLRLLDLPPAVRLAISGKQLSVSLAEQLFRLSNAERERVASLIASGEDPQGVIRRATAAQPKRSAPRAEPPDHGKARENIEVLVAFLRGGLESYIRFLERGGEGNAACIERVGRVREAAAEMLKRPQTYVRNATHFA